jgi:hypothetical protein
MNIGEYVFQYFREPKNILIGLLNHCGGILTDKAFLKCQYYLQMGKKLDIDNPQTYNEKLQWLKLYNRKPEYTIMVDKYAVKDYVASKIGEEYVIPTLGVWDRPEDIDWLSLPQQFVLKTTHGGGSTGVVVCRNKNTFDREEAVKKLNRSLKQDIYKTLREWPYKNVKKRIIAEKYIEDKKTGELADYKFFCFDGEVKALFVGTERGSGDVKFDYYDSEYNHLDLVQYHPMSDHQLPKPCNFELMKKLASQLSKGIPQIRVDLYECNGRVYFGELTFFHHGGIVPFHPESWDYTFGSWITLPSKTN